MSGLTGTSFTLSDGATRKRRGFGKQASAQPFADLHVASHYQGRAAASSWPHRAARVSQMGHQCVHAPHKGHVPAWCWKQYRRSRDHPWVRVGAAFHRTIESLRLKKTSEITKSNPSPTCPLTTSIITTSPWFLSTSRDSDSTASPGSLCQCITTLSENKLFLISNLNLSYHDTSD